MRHNVLCLALLALASGPAGLDAQGVPGRDLLLFPIGSVGEAPALARLAADGLHNPALATLERGHRARLTAGTMTTRTDQGVSAQLAAISGALPASLTASVSVVRVSVNDLVRTETDPQTVGDIPYSTTLTSLVIARRSATHVSAGAALRRRSGVADGLRGSEWSADAGVILDGIAPRDLRVGLGTFLWRPGVPRRGSAFEGAADFRAAGRSPRNEVRLGYSVESVRGLSREQYANVAARLGLWEVRGGPVLTTVGSDRAWRMRLGVGLHYARYVFGIARDDQGAALAPAYHFVLSTTLQ